MAAAFPLSPEVAESRTAPVLKATPRAWHMASAAGLAILWILLYFRHVGDLGLYSDDWGHLQIAETDSYRAMIGNWPMDYRPLEELPWVLFHAVFGQAYGWYYVVLFSIGLATALLLYVLAERATGRPLLALGAAVLWTVYPADLSQFWLSGIHFRLGLLFWGLGLVLLTDRRIPANRGYVGALLCCAISAVSYELFLGALFSLPLIASLTSSQRDPVGRSRRAAPFLVIFAAYLAYRFIIGPHLLRLPDVRGNEVHLSPTVFLSSQESGFVTLLLKSWQAARGDLGFVPTPYDGRVLITYLPSAPIGVGTVEWLLFYLYLITGLLLLMSWLRRRRLSAVWAAMRPGVHLLGLGLAAISAGFLVIATTGMSPNLQGIASRANVVAIPGAALALAGTIWVLAHWLPLPPWAARGLFVVGIGAFSLLGYEQTARTGAIYAESWTTQQQMWGALHEAAPELAPGTFVLIVAGDQAGADTVATLQSWGLASALSLRYPSEGISGDFLTDADLPTLCTPTRDIYNGEPKINSAGYLPRNSTAPTGYGSIVALRYVGAGGGRMTVLQGWVPLGGSSCGLASHGNRVLSSGAPR